MPWSGPQVNYFPSFQTLSSIRHADSSPNSYAPLSKLRTRRREAQSRDPVNKLKKNSPYMAIYNSQMNMTH
jgi:hypothetical protein